MFDMGYDISNFTEVDPIFGTLQDFKDLVKGTHSMGMKIIVDFVPNHTSDKHKWFEMSIKKIDPYTNYYIWRKGRTLPNGTITYPNNWVIESEQKTNSLFLRIILKLSITDVNFTYVLIYVYR